MNDLMKRIFNLFKYEEVSSDDVLLYKSSLMDDYWVVYTGLPEKLVDTEFQSELLQQCKKVCPDSALEKNLNIICLWNVDSHTQDIRKTIHNIEEDVYFFKKHVLQYSSSELFSFINAETDHTLQSMFSELVVDSSVFKKYKLNVHDNSWESFLYRICIKLTFIKIKNNENDEIQGLYTNHMNKLSGRNDLLALERAALELDIKELDDSMKVLAFLVNELEESQL